ncbi:MAG TPA: serine/threonine-protein kinase [Polyangiales bacterium]|nr:serine/threonine-protein kinase [Polyangiales bacterium]
MPARKHSEVQPAGAELYGQLAGEYRIGRKLGAGGFGTVFEAEHPVLKRKAAVKVLHANPAVDSMAVQRFIEEARSASQIRHRHIVDIFSFGTLPNGRYFYVMDLLEGAPLDRYLHEQSQLSPELALQLLRPIASAIDALHAASLVHRDLKPGNIFLAWEASGEVVPKLLDFGLVKLLGTTNVQTTTGAPIGTPYYMAPEQCQGAKVDGRADIYSLGVVCFELLSGKPPFTGDSATAVLIAHVLQEPPRLSAFRPELPVALDEPLLRMLAKAPEARPSSAAEALAELEAAVRSAGLTVSDRPPVLPRPQLVAASLENDATVAQSGTRTGPGAPAAARRRTRWIWLAVAPLALLIWYLGGLSIEGVAPPPPPAPSRVAPPPAAATLPTPSPQPAVEAVAPPPPRMIAIRLRGAPASAEVWLDDQKLGTAPGPVLVPYAEQPRQLSLRVAGRPDRTLSVTPDADQELTLPPEKPARKRQTLPRDLENPF